MDKEEVKEYLEEDSEVKESLGLGDVWRHAQASGGFILAASSRPEYDDEMVEKKFNELIDLVRSYELGYYKVDGRWVDKETDELYEEPSLFIPYRDILTSEEFLEVAIEIAQKFKQDSVLVSTPEDGESFHLVTKDGSIDMTFDKGRYDKVSDVYSTIRDGSHKGKSFFFEDFVVWRPGCWSEALSYYNKGGL